MVAGLAIGAAIGTAMRKVWGEGRAISAEETAVEGALMLRKARAAFEEEVGRPITAAEAQKFYRAYEAQLVLNGFDRKPNGQWYRPRTAVERLLG